MILITGSNGMVGSYFKEEFQDEELLLTDIDTLDIRNYGKVFSTISNLKPKFVINLAAETDVDKCETEIDHAFHTNVIGTSNVALACQANDIIMVHISTAGVFDGEKHDSYTEFDAPNPQNIYGKTKFEADKVVMQTLKRYYIFRPGWMIGGKEKDKKFVAKIIKLIQKGQTNLNVVNDKFGSPTYAKELVRGIKEIIKTGYFGLYHMTNKGTCSRYEVAQEIVNFLKKDVKITPISSAAYPLPALRVRSEAMRNYKLDLLGLNNMSNWQDALHDYLSSWIGSC
ncbi:MAG: dTDP-4-dehydrorhamnose reductase [bacterium]|nr:dTDP-4-dehydrorhamnose reductase [bacterium]